MQPKTIPFGQEPAKPKVIPFGSSPAPVAPTKTPTANPYSGKGMVGQVTDFATSFASGVGQDVIGALRTGNKIYGATVAKPLNSLIKFGTGVDATKKADEFLGKVNENIYKKPFAGSQETVGGMVGATAEKIAPYFVSGGTAGALRSGIANRLIQTAPTAVADTLIGASQAQGDMKVGVATGLSSLAGYGIMPTKGGFLKNTIQGGTLPGYISDVAMGLSGQRGEDRTGASALIPGLGTALGTGIGAVGAKANPAVKEYKVQKIVDKRAKELRKFEMEYSRVREASDDATKAGINAKKALAETDFLHGAVDENGRVSTKQPGGALDRFDNEVLSGHDKYVGEELGKAKETVSPAIAREKVVSVLRNDKNTKGLLSEADIQKRANDIVETLSRDADSFGNIPLTSVHDAKINRAKPVNYGTETQSVAKAIVRSLKEIVEEHAKTFNVKAYNERLRGYYAIRDMIESLDGTRVEGGRLGKHVASTLGAVLGTSFGAGPIPVIMGAELARYGQGLRMAGKMRGKTGTSVDKSMGWQPIQSLQSSNKTGSRNTNQSTTMIPRTSDIPVIPPIVLPPTPKAQPKKPLLALPAPKPSAIPMGGLDAQGRKIDAQGNLIVPPQPKNAGKVVDAKKFSYQDKKTGKFARGYSSEGGFSTPKTMLGVGLGSLSGFEKDENGKIKYNVAKGLAGAGLGGLIGNKGKIGMAIEDISKNLDASDRNMMNEFVDTVLGKNKTPSAKLGKDIQQLADAMGLPEATRGNKALANKLAEILDADRTAIKAKFAEKDTSHLAKAKEALREAKGLSPADIMSKHPDINLKRDVPITDVRGNKAVIPAGEALTPYELKGNKVLLQDGETYIVSKNQWQNIKGNAVSGEAKEFAPELKGTEETVKGTQKMAVRDKAYADFDAGKITREQRNAIIDKLGVPNETKYSSYTLPDGKNYKEVLIRAPETPMDIPKTDYEIRPKGSGVGVYDKTHGHFVTSVMDEAPARASMENLIEIENKRSVRNAGNFNSSHWSEPNVISHLRLNERTYNGKPVTFMEELQSDWAREGRSKGFAGGVSMKELEAQKSALQEQITKSGVSWDKQPAEIVTKWHDTIAKMDAISQGNEIPNNPLLKNWQTLSVKRALQEAVANKSEYFAWINGEQTSARYNLATHLDKAKWYASSGGEIKQITLIPKEGKTTIEVFTDKDGTISGGTESSWKGKKLDEVLGKGLADSIMSKESGTLSGDGLKFGGEWANTLYDKQVKNIVEDVTGGKVEMMDMGLPIEGKKAFQWESPSGEHSGWINMSEPEVFARRAKVGMPIRKDGGEMYIITDILGDGKFKAVPKKIWDEVNRGHGQFTGVEKAERMREHFGIDSAVESFDISTKTTTQQGIRLTPEIIARIKGEAPALKKPSGLTPFLGNATKQP